MADELYLLFQKCIEALRRHNVTFALGGGLAANVYRNETRDTHDVDVVLIAEDSAQELGEEILKELDLSVGEVTEAQLKGGPLFAIRNRSARVQILVGRVPNDKNKPGVDIILPAMPWAKVAVERAQSNQRDLGLAKPIPVLTIEDLVISKLFAFRDKATRLKDLDDLKAILSNRPTLDNDYLAQRIKEYSLPIPEAIQQYCHYKVLRVARKLSKGQSL